MTTKVKNLGTLHSGDVYVRPMTLASYNADTITTVIKYYVIVGVEDRPVNGLMAIGIPSHQRTVPHVSVYELTQIDGEFEYLEPGFSGLKYVPLESLFSDILDDAKFHSRLDGSITYDNFVDSVMRSERRMILVWTLTNLIMFLGFILLRLIA